MAIVYSKEIPVVSEVDVLVVGGGPAGLMAAQAAALVEGTKVMLIENRGSLGGNMTQGLPLLGFLGRKGNEIIKGLPLRFVETLRSAGIETFVYTNQSTAVMENLHAFAAEGCTMMGLCTITRQETRWGEEEPYEVQGIRFSLN